MHGKISKVFLEKDYLFKDLPEEIQAVRYHSLILDNLPESLEIIGGTEKNEIMAIRHIELNIRGLQFHPEAILTDYGKMMLLNWVRHNDI